MRFPFYICFSNANCLVYHLNGCLTQPLRSNSYAGWFFSLIYEQMALFSIGLIAPIHMVLYDNNCYIIVMIIHVDPQLWLCSSLSAKHAGAVSRWDHCLPIRQEPGIRSYTLQIGKRLPWHRLTKNIQNMIGSTIGQLAWLLFNTMC